MKPVIRPLERAPPSAAPNRAAVAVIATMRMVAMLAFLIAFVNPVLAGPIPICGYGPRITCIVDGDTLWFEGVKIRLTDIDAPEEGGRARCAGERRLALAARDRLAALLSAAAFTIEPSGFDRYGRTLATLRIGGTSVGEVLVTEHLARRWPDGEKFWCK